MRVSPILTNCPQKINITASRVSTNAKNSVSEVAPYSNEVNFKGFLEDMIYYFPKKLEVKREAKKQEQFKVVEDKIHDDVSLIAQRQQIPISVAKERYEERLNAVAIPLKKDGNEEGLNKVVGYSLEKFQATKDLLLPLKANAKIPNGMLLYGPARTGKTHFAEALGEHIEKLGLGKFKVFEFDSDTRNGYTTSMLNFFESAEKEYEKTGERQILFFDDIDLICEEEDRSNVRKMFLVMTKDCSKKGITWIGTTNEPSLLPDMLYKPSRLNSDIYVNRMSDAEKSAVMSYSWKARDRKDNSDHDMLLDTYRLTAFHFYPPQVERVSQMTDEYMSKNVDKHHDWYNNYDKKEKKPVETRYVSNSIDRYNLENKRNVFYQSFADDAMTFVKMKRGKFEND